MTTQKENVLTVIKDNSLTAIIRRDETTGHRLFYKCIEMVEEDLEDLLAN